MDRGDKERWQKLSPAAKVLVAVINDHIIDGDHEVTVNTLRKYGSSTTIMRLLTELQQRGFGRIYERGDMGPVFMAIIPYFQSLEQAGYIVDKRQNL